MKKFTKLFLSCAAIAAVTAAVATSAMAAEPTITATYEDANLNGELTLKVQGATGEVTLLVTQKALTETIADADILYIDQETDGAFAEKVVLRKAGTEATQYLEDGKYNVYVGYTDGDDFKVATKTFTIGAAGTEITIGDINLDTKLQTADVTCLMRGMAGLEKGTGKYGTEYVNTADQTAVTIGDINLDTKLQTADVTCLMRGMAGLEKGTGKYGTTVTVTEK